MIAAAASPTLIAAAAPTVIRVKAFGATGDGVTDDRPAIQSALNAARLLGSAAVYFDPGVYNLASATSLYGQLALQDWAGPYRIDLIGNGATLQTSQTGSLLFAQGYWQNSTVQGLTFRNVHPITTQTTAAITFQGGGQNAIQNWTIKGNAFSNFSRHIAISGVTGLNIAGNTFQMTAGRDSGTATNPEPNVAVWMFNNTPGGTSVNIQVTGNQYDGCSGGSVAGTASRACGDGFLYGEGSGVVANDNIVRRFSFEGIYLFPDTTGGAPPLIDSNTVDGIAVPGDIYQGGQWGIRCDANGAVISRNSISNTANGIVLYGVGLAADITGTSIVNNYITASAGVRQPLYSGIQVTAASNILISGNTLSIASLPTSTSEVSLIYVSGLLQRFSSGVTVSGNSIISALTSTTTSGIYLQFTAGWGITGNTVEGESYGLHTMNLSGPQAVLVSFGTSNTLLNLANVSFVSNGWFI